MMMSAGVAPGLLERTDEQAVMSGLLDAARRGAAKAGWS
jgi:hypothetical protein